jgi:hypothetical protein
MVIASGSCGAEAIEYAADELLLLAPSAARRSHLTGDDREDVGIDGEELPGAVRGNLWTVENERDRVRSLLDDLP